MHFFSFFLLLFVEAWILRLLFTVPVSFFHLLFQFFINAFFSVFPFAICWSMNTLRLLSTVSPLFSWVQKCQMNGELELGPSTCPCLTSSPHPLIFLLAASLQYRDSRGAHTTPVFGANIYDLVLTIWKS